MFGGFEFTELISAGSYLQFPAGFGRWKTEKDKEQNKLIIISVVVWF